MFFISAQKLNKFYRFLAFIKQLFIRVRNILQYRISILNPQVIFFVYILINYPVFQKHCDEDTCFTDYFQKEEYLKEWGLTRNKIFYNKVKMVKIFFLSVFIINALSCSNRVDKLKNSSYRKSVSNSE